MLCFYTLNKIKLIESLKPGDYLNAGRKLDNFNDDVMAKIILVDFSNLSNLSGHLVLSMKTTISVHWQYFVAVS